MNGLSCGEEIMTIYSAVLIQYQRVTDGRTDGQTDVHPISITCFSIADGLTHVKMNFFNKIYDITHTDSDLFKYVFHSGSDKVFVATVSRYIQ